MLKSLLTSSEGSRALKMELALALRLTGHVTLDKPFLSQPQFPRGCSVDRMKAPTSSSDKCHKECDVPSAGLVLSVCLMNEGTQWVA